jgi:hypothetical protein
LPAIVRLAIGIPTRNRAELAMASIASVVRSGLAGITVVVSDNSTDRDEAERLEEFCAGQPAAVVEYIRPPEPLAMAAHWEWLWHRIDETVSPSHVTYLTDRLVFTAGALADLVEVIEAHPSQVVTYHWDHVKDLSTPVELVQTPWTGQLLELDCGKLIEMSSRGESGDYLPRLMTCIAPAALLDTIEKQFGDVFGSVSPDFRFAFRCLAVCETVLYLDRACLIEHGMGRSAGGSYRRGNMSEDAARFARELAVPRFGATPEPGFETTANAIFQEYCAVRDEVGGRRFPPPDRRGYLTANALSVEQIQEPQWRARMEDLLSRHGWTRRDRVRHSLGVALGMSAYLVRHPGALRRTLKRQLWDRPPGAATASLLERLGFDPRVRDDLRFESVEQAIAHADSHPRTPTPHAWHVHRLARAGAIAGQVGDGRATRR